MAILTQLNSKGNIRRTSSADMPYNAQFPVLNQYTAVSTTAQTVINLPFSIDQTVPESLQLYIDGKLMCQGALNDYTFTAIDVNNTSSQVTLNFALSAGLNIIAVKLGFKKEAEFNMDNRFVQLYANQSQAFQGFVDTNSNRLLATTTTGTPVAGYFYSSITNRASLPDMTQDLKVRFGISRTMTQQCFQIQNELGPNGEAVYGIANDTFGTVRLIGTDWAMSTGTSGVGLKTNNNGDSMEITFYGTGLNILTTNDTASRDYRASVDGGSAGSNLYFGNVTAAVVQRNFNANVVISAVSGLALGVHTITILNNSANGMFISGFETVHQATTATNVIVNPGISYIQGQKITSNSQQLFDYNSIATGLKGGRVLVYQALDGTIGKAWQATNASQANLASADHTNEEVARSYYPSEFSASRTDDWSTLTSTSTARAFTLDSDAVTLIGSSSQVGASPFTPTKYGVYFSLLNFVTITFVGTGLDIELNIGSSETSTYGITIDGTSVGNLTYTAGKFQIYKIVSGLSYGTHTVKIAPTGAAPSQIVLTRYMVYQPKKPTLPSGAVELADYNVVGTLLFNSTAGSEYVSRGVIRKVCTREIGYNGTWSVTQAVGAGTTGTVGGYHVATTTATNYFQYTFYGTGFDMRLSVPNAVAGNYTLTIDGLAPSTTNFPGSATSVYGGITGFNSTTGVITTNTAGNYASGATIYGLPLGTHTVKVVYNSGSFLRLEAIDVVTPVHSFKSNLQFDEMNTLTVGNQAISDNRQFSPIKESWLQKKNISQAIGIASAPSTSSTAYVTCPDMSVTHTNTSGRIRVSYSIANTNPSTLSNFFIVSLNGVLLSFSETISGSGSSYINAMSSSSFDIPVPVGTNNIDVYWKVSSAGTGTLQTTNRVLLVEEI